MLAPELISKLEITILTPMDENLVEPEEQLLLQKGAIFNLFEDQSPDAVRVLWKCAAQSSSGEIQQACIWVLSQLASKYPEKILDYLFDLAIRKRNIHARKFLRDANLLAQNSHYAAVFALVVQGAESFRRLDPGYRLLSEFFFNLADSETQEIILGVARTTLPKWHCITSSVISSRPDKLDELVVNFPQFDNAERELCFSQLKTLASNNSESACSSLLALFLQHDFLPARDYLVQTGYHSENPVQAALFYFLSEQWQEYESLDFDHSLITNAYELASPALKDRLLTISRSSGNIEWTDRLSTASRRHWLGTLTEADWRSIVDALKQETRWSDLWRMAQSAPPFWSARIMANWPDPGWRPTADEEIEQFINLSRQSHLCLANLQLVSLLQLWQHPAQEITCFTVNWKSQTIAAGNSTSQLHLWKLVQPVEPKPSIIDPVARTHSLAFSPSGDVLAAANGDNAIRLFDATSGRLLKTMQGHGGLVRSLCFSPDGRYLYSAGFDGCIFSWRIPEGTLLKTFYSQNSEIFSLFLADGGAALISAGADRAVSVFRLADGERIRLLTGHQDTIINLAGTPDSQILATHSRNKEIRLWNFSSGKSLGMFNSPEIYTALALEPKGRLLFGGTIHGNITILNLPEGSIFQRLNAHRAAVTGLWIASAGETLISSSSDGSFCWWDLRLLKFLLTPVDELLGAAEEIKTLGQKKDRKPADYAWYGYTSTLIDWRRRYDIQIADPKSLIHIGNFDIEL